MLGASPAEMFRMVWTSCMDCDSPGPPEQLLEIGDGAGAGIRPVAMVASGRNGDIHLGGTGTYMNGIKPALTASDRMT